MTDREVEKMLKNAYSLPESESGQSFIKKYERRSNQICDIIINEFRYMGLKSFLAGLVLCALFMVIVRKGDENMVWIISSTIPICSLVPMTLIFRSQRYGMSELEAASRFSLKFIRLIRMLILGIFSAAVILAGSIFLRKLWQYGILDVVMYILLPYFVSIWGCLLIARKWHGKESTIAVPVLCIATGFLPTIIRELRYANFTPDYIYVILTVIIIAAVVKECIKFVNERSDLSWNLY